MKVTAVFGLFISVLCWILFVSIAKPISLEVGSVQKPIQVSTFEDTIFCCEPSTEHETFPLFEEILIYVKEVHSKKIPWYHVKGVSTDDLHAVLENILFAAFGKSELDVHGRNQEPFEVESFVRDIASSCPNPLYGRDRSQCTMRFSMLGKACVTIRATNPPMLVSVHAEKRLNTNLLVRLLVGSLLTLMAGYLAHNLLFQYSLGAIAFMLGGVLILVALLLNYLISARNQYATFLRSVLVALLASGVYATSLAWYLRTHWTTIVLKYWEYTVGYLVVTGIAGLVYTQVLRNDDKTKHNIAVAVKWTLRIAGAITVYNASASPLGSVILLTGLLVIYVVYAGFKWSHPSAATLSKASVKVGVDKAEKKE